MNQGDPQGSGARLLTVVEVAEMLRVHERTLRRWVEAGRFPCIRVGSRIRFSREDVGRWLSARREG
jgi:excisionase family DNA binding protein